MPTVCFPWESAISADPVLIWKHQQNLGRQCAGTPAPEFTNRKKAKVPTIGNGVTATAARYKEIVSARIYKHNKMKIIKLHEEEYVTLATGIELNEIPEYV